MVDPFRGALMLVRLVAVCVIVIGMLDVGLYLTKCYEIKHPMPVKVLPIVWNSVPALIGIVILAKARAIAEWVSDKLE
jgi:tellurite resistance protein TehA-like permease